MATDEMIEQEIQAKGLTAPRIVPDDIEANIVAETYFTAGEGLLGAHSAHGGVYQGYGQVHHESLDLLTICVLVLRNGFTVTGESACASPENFDAEIGRTIARQNAVEKIWPLMGYALRERLARAREEIELTVEVTPRGDIVVADQHGRRVAGVQEAAQRVAFDEPRRLFVTLTCHRDGRPVID